MLSLNVNDGGDVMKTVKLPRHCFLAAAIVCPAIAAAVFSLFYIYLDGVEPLAVHIIFTLIMLSEISLALIAFVFLYGALWEYRYGDAGFICTNIFGRERMLYYSDIRRLKRTYWHVLIYDQSKRYGVSLLADNVDAFLFVLSRKSGIPMK